MTNVEPSSNPGKSAAFREIAAPQGSHSPASRRMFWSSFGFSNDVPLPMGRGSPLEKRKAQ